MKSEDTFVRLGDLANGPVRRHLEADATERAVIAEQIGVETLASLSADFVVRPWMDGCEVKGRFQAEVIQICGVTLEPFSQSLEGEIELRFAPPGSPSLVDPTEGEVEVSLDAPDPPDLLRDDKAPLDEILLEHLALAVDPFPRRPDAVFQWEPDNRESSPFAILKGRKGAADQ
ncbi:MAG: YceD family protein [Phenylobacterium sp.]